MHSRNCRTPKYGFTLIELLVVIAIIAILAAILFPVFAQARAAARKTNGISMTKQVALSILMYNQDYDEKFPRSGWSCSGFWTNNSCNVTQWPNVTAPYHKNAQIVQDPADGSKFGSSTYVDGRFTLLYNDLLSHHPTIVADGRADWGDTPNEDKNPEREQTPLSNAEVNSPADCVMITEGFCPWGTTDNVANSPLTDLAAWTGERREHSKWKAEQSMSQYQAILITGTNYTSGWNAFTGLPIHQQGTVYAYTDGHAKWTKAYDPGGAGKAPYFGNLLHGTLPFRKNYDPGQHRADLDPGVGLGTASDNWH